MDNTACSPYTARQERRERATAHTRWEGEEETLRHIHSPLFESQVLSGPALAVACEYCNMASACTIRTCDA